MSIKNKNVDAYSEYERAFNVEVLQSQIFGAFYSALEYRKNHANLTNVEIARRSGWSRSAVTKTMAKPQNWTIETIAKMATALDVAFEFKLVDRTNPIRCFDANGMIFNLGRQQGSTRQVQSIKNQRVDTAVQILTPIEHASVYNGPKVQSQAQKSIAETFVEHKHPGSWQ
jgi:DNA-binding phage protein